MSMERWPGHERTQTTGKSNGKAKGDHTERRPGPGLWRWPHLDYGSVGSATLVSEDGRVRWSTVVETSHHQRWSPLGKPTRVFPATRPPRVNINQHSARQRAEKGLQYVRAYFPDADFPGELLGGALEADAREMRRLKGFDPLLGNLLETIPSHHVQNEYAIAFPMGKLGSELNISRFSSDGSGNMVVNPTGSPSVAFETPILQISAAAVPSPWISAPSNVLLVRTHTSSSLLRLAYSNVTRELDITRSETGNIPIVDSRILGSGPDIVVVDRSGKVYRCNTYHGGKAMRSIGAHEASNDHFWQLSTTGRDDECFLMSCKAVKHIDLRSPEAEVMFSLDHPSAIVTSFESPTHDHICRTTTTSDVVWLDDRFRRQPLLSFKHYRNFDRTLRVLTANLSGASFSLLTSRRNGLVTLYDISRGADSLLHCNSIPSCLPHDGPVATAYDGHTLVAFPPDARLTFLRLSQRGSVHRQDIHVAQSDKDQSGPVQEGHVTHHWDEDILALEKQADEFQIDFGPAGGRHFTEVNLRGAYEKMFAYADHTREGMDPKTFEDALARLPNVLQDIEGNTESMLTTFDVISGIEDGDKHSSRTNFLSGGSINSKQMFDTLMSGHPVTQKLTGLARWHYNIQDTSIPALDHWPDDYAVLHESLKGLNLVSEVERHEVSVQQETEAREQLVVDLALSRDMYSGRPFAKHHSFTASESVSDTVARPTEILYSEEPPEIKLGYLRPIRKVGADHYAEKERDGEQGTGISSPLGVRLLLAEWELGTDPDDYTYRDPYGRVDMDVQPVPRYRKLAAAALATQKKQIPPRRPPLVIATATQPPVVHTVERHALQQTYSQPAERDIDAPSQEPAVSTQVLPGPHGGRPGRKGGKRRMGGF